MSKRRKKPEKGADEADEMPRKKKKNWELTIRKITAIILFVSAIFVIVSGILLYSAPSGRGSGEAIALGLTKDTWIDLHVWSGFIASGCLVVHLYMNRRPLIRYMKDVFSGKI